MALSKQVRWFFLFGALLSGVSAHAMEQNRGAWTGLFIQGKVNDHWGWFLENQLRLHDGWDYAGGQPDSLETRANRILLRPAVRWMPTGSTNLQFALGWGWTPNLSPERDEHRLWEQVLFQGGNPREGWGWMHRVRLEQRHIEYTRGLQHRARYMARGARFLDDQGVLGGVVWGEVFWNLNGVARGPVSGLDQTRVFVGPLFQVSPGARFELGYLNVYYPKGAARDSLMSHLLGTFIQFDLP